MLNYLKSESYRLIRKRNLYLTTLLCFGLITAFTFVLVNFQRVDASFRYGSASFLYSNVFGSVFLIIFIGLVFNLALTGKDKVLMKQSISYGVSRGTIFWSKLILTLLSFLIVCGLGILLSVVLGQNLLPSDGEVLRNYLLACINLSPLIISGFIVSHALLMNKVNLIPTIAIMFVIFGFSGRLVKIFAKFYSNLESVIAYTPETMFNQILQDFMDRSVKLEGYYWGVSILIMMVSLTIGYISFTKEDIE